MEPDKFVVDSSVFVAFYHQGEHNHEMALEVLSSLKDKALIVHPYVVQETATVLTYTDSALLTLAKKQKAQLLTFDRQMLASFKE